MANASVQRSILSHSRREAPRNASAHGPTSAHQVIAVSVIVRRRNPLDPSRLTHTLSHQEFLERYAADPADFEQLRHFAHQNGLTVDETASSLARRTLVLRGTAEAMQRAFGVELHDYAHSSGHAFHSFTGAVSVPSEHAPRIEAVLGLDNRPIAEPNIRIHSDKSRADDTSASFNPNQIASMYAFPNASGQGQTVGIIELGGGYYPSDILTYFAELGLPLPTVLAVSVDGATNQPGFDTDADGEVALDIQVVGATAPGVRIVVYFAPNTDQGFLDALTTAAHDTTNQPSAISISWGGSETGWAQSSLTAFDAACQSAGALGITVTVASGDLGSTNGESVNTVQFPASSPNVLACGGTRIAVASGKITSEVVWDDGPDSATGGGVSVAFPVLAWQNGLTFTPTGGSPQALTGRGVPDVAGDASPYSGYNILLNGVWSVFGGTSAVAPLWAGLLAVVNQLRSANGLGTAGFISPTLYAAANVTNDITSGNNGGYMATTGWDACTGLGSPIGTAIATALGVVYPSISIISLENKGAFVVDIHALYRSTNSSSYTERANKDNFPVGKTRTMNLAEKCTDPDIAKGDYVQCKAWVQAGSDNTNPQVFVYDPAGPTQSFKITGTTLSNTLTWLSAPSATETVSMLVSESLASRPTETLKPAAHHPRS